MLNFYGKAHEAITTTMAEWPLYSEYAKYKREWMNEVLTKGPDIPECKCKNALDILRNLGMKGECEHALSK